MRQKTTYIHGSRKNRRNTFFFQIVCILLSATLLLCGCNQNAAQAGTTSTTAAANDNTDTSPQDPFLLLQQWLQKDCSFTLSYQYINLAINGISQETVQTFAEDGCWSLATQRKVWDHTDNYEYEDNAEFYYLYEDSQLVCYTIMNGDAPQRTVLTETALKEINDSKAYTLGVPGLLPDYLQNLSITQTDDAAIFTYALPLDKVLTDGTLLAAYIQNVCALSGYNYYPETQLLIGCTFETDPETFQPRSLSFDFSQLKPYVLSGGAQSGEVAFHTNCMTLVYTFDYDLPSTITIPENLLS